MANSQMDGVLCHLRRTALSPVAGLTDGQLLERFLTTHEPAVFEAILRRHGPMVLAVCRRVLRHEQDAEDAFQATFLVLVRNATSVTVRGSVGSWLYGVANRTAQKARVAMIRRRAKEKRMARPESRLEPDDFQRELRRLIDQELTRLPEKYRELIVLCDLEGQSRKEAARRIGCPEGTVSGRLARARVMLAKRLIRRGLKLSAGPLALALAPNSTSACVPVSLSILTVKTATLVAAGHTVSAAISAPVASLTEGVLKAMNMSKIKCAFAVVLALGIFGAGWGVYRTQAAPLGNKPAPGASSPAPAPPTEETAKDDEKINLPKGQAPIQVLASIDKDGKLVIKTAVMTFGQVGVGGGFVRPGGAPIPPGGPNAQPPFPGGGAAPLAARVQAAWKAHSQTYDLAEVEVLDTKGKTLDKKDVVKLLKKETVALASQWGQKVDPLHLRLIKDGTLTFILPAAKFNVPNIAVPPVQGLPQPVPPVPPGAPGQAPSGTGIAVPGTVTSPAAPPIPVPPGPRN